MFGVSGEGVLVIVGLVGVVNLNGVVGGVLGGVSLVFGSRFFVIFGFGLVGGLVFVGSNGGLLLVVV